MGRKPTNRASSLQRSCSTISASGSACPPVRRAFCGYQDGSYRPRECLQTAFDRRSDNSTSLHSPMGIRLLRNKDRCSQSVTVAGQILYRLRGHAARLSHLELQLPRQRQVHRFLLWSLSTNLLCQSKRESSQRVFQPLRREVSQLSQRSTILVRAEDPESQKRRERERGRTTKSSFIPFTE